MALKVLRAGTEQYGRYIKALVCGDPGAGKTRSSSNWPNPLVLNAEGGLMSIADRQTPFITIKNTSELLEIKAALMQSPEIREKTLGVPVDTVIIDTIDEIARMFVRERLEATKKDTLAIQDWGWLGDQLRNIVRTYRNLDMNVILNCHLKSTEDADSGRMYLKPGIQGAMGDEIAGFVDLAVTLTARPIVEVVDGKNVRRIVRFYQTYPDAQHPWIKDRSGKLPMEFPINFDDDHKRLDALIYGETAPAPEAQVPIVPTKADVEETLPEPKSQPDPQPEPEPQPEPKPEPKKRASRRGTVKTEAKVVDEVVDLDAALDEAIGETVPQPATTVPEPEPLIPEPELEPTPEPESEDISADLEDEDDEDESVSADETPAPERQKEPWETCQNCGNPTESRDQADLSYIRHRQYLCRPCFNQVAKKR